MRDNVTPDTNAVDVGTGSAPLGVNTKTGASALPNTLKTKYPIEANVIAGVFKLSYGGAMTGDLSVTATASDVETALNNASIMGAGAVSVQRFHPSGAGSGVGPGPAGGYQWAVTFVGDNVGGNVDMLVAAEVQNLVATNPNMAIVEATAGNQLQGAFTLRAWDGSAASTGHLDYYISDSDLETQLSVVTARRNARNGAGLDGGNLPAEVDKRLRDVERGQQQSFLSMEERLAVQTEAVVERCAHLAFSFPARSSAVYMYVVLIVL